MISQGIRVVIAPRRLKLRQIWSKLMSICLALVMALGPTAAAFATPPAETTATAERLFSVHCAGCHPHGGNIVRRGKTLKQNALQRHGVDSVTAIATLITQGRGSMSAYRDRLSPAEIDQLAHYVWQQAQDNWGQEASWLPWPF